MFAVFTTIDGYQIFVNPFAVESFADSDDGTDPPWTALHMRSGRATHRVQGTARSAYQALRDAAYEYANAHEPSYQ